MLEGIVAAVLATTGCTPSRTAPVVSDAGAADATPPPLAIEAVTYTGRSMAPFPDQATFSCAPESDRIHDDVILAAGVDTLEILEQQLGSGKDRYVVHPPRTKQLAARPSLRKGQPCVGVGDPEACAADLERARTTTTIGWDIHQQKGPGTPRARIAVYTRDGKVGLATTQDETLALLGPIDTLGEARFVAQAIAHEPFYCERPTVDGFVLPDPGWRRNADGGWELISVEDECGSVTRKRFVVGVDATVRHLESQTLYTDQCSGIAGRRLEGLHARASRGEDVGAYFAEVAWLEAASVVAFRRVESDLVALGAPDVLVAAARRAQADEVRHAREASALARRFGASERALHVEPPTERDRLAIALENAVEGCVRETYGALVAAYQARRAEDPAVRTFFERIAADEAHHAELSHAIAAWLEPSLPDNDRACLASARASAFAELMATTGQKPPGYATMAGLPSPADARLLLEGLERAVLRDSYP